MSDEIDIQKLAKLARVKVSDNTAGELADSISEVLDYVENVQELAGDTDTKQADSPVHNILREDSDPHSSGAYREALLAEAPEVDEEGFVVVPPILSQDNE